MRPAAAPPAFGGAEADPVAALRSRARRGLARMYRPHAQRFVFRLRRTPYGVVGEGSSLRYTSIALLGLAGEPEKAAVALLAGHRPYALCSSLLEGVGALRSLGDVALLLWVSRALRHHDWERALRRLVELRPLAGTPPTVELAWTLAALSADADLPAADLRAGVAGRLVAALSGHSSLFPHVVDGSPYRPRAHVSCFADLAYPIHALSRYSRLTGDRAALAAARRCAERLVGLQGPDGQWWWHYDVRSGDVIEPYPVYAVHQDAMAPLALFALEDAGQADFGRPVARGLSWLQGCPELAGGSLIDGQADLIWRKVARHEPGKLSRSVQALASRVHRRLRVPALDLVFPPGAVDYEDRPYHLGWILYAWPETRLGRWRTRRAQ